MSHHLIHVINTTGRDAGPGKHTREGGRDVICHIILCHMSHHLIHVINTTGRDAGPGKHTRKGGRDVINAQGDQSYGPPPLATHAL